MPKYLFAVNEPDKNVWDWSRLVITAPDRKAAHARSDELERLFNRRLEYLESNEVHHPDGRITEHPYDVSEYPQF